MERYVPKQKGRVIKTILFVVFIAGIFLFFRYDIHKKIFGIFSSDKKNKAGETDSNGSVARRFVSLTEYDIENYAPQKVKNIKQSEWIVLIQRSYRVGYNLARRFMYFNDIYSLPPRWCWIVTNNVSIKKRKNKFFLNFELRKSDKTYFKLKGSEQIYAANTPTLKDIFVTASFYGMPNTDKPVVYKSKQVVLKADSQKPYKKIILEISPENITDFKVLVINIPGIKYFVFK